MYILNGENCICSCISIVIRPLFCFFRECRKKKRQDVSFKKKQHRVQNKLKHAGYTYVPSIPVREPSAVEDDDEVLCFQFEHLALYCRFYHLMDIQIIIVFFLLTVRLDIHL